MTKRIKLTPKGIEEIQQELDTLKNIKRPKLVERLANAREQGDLSENSDYISAKEELGFMDDRISELEDILITAQIVKPTSKGSVGIGSVVTLQRTGKKTTVQYTIVGDMEADPKNNKISISSPLGVALEGKKVGSKAQYTAPVGTIEYEIVAVE